jgi:hypothetical protein
MTERKEVVLEPREGRVYYATTWTEKVIDPSINCDYNIKNTRYFSTAPLEYAGKYIGGRIEGWGKDLKEWAHFLNKQGEEVIILYNKDSTTAFCEV